MTLSLSYFSTLKIAYYSVDLKKKFCIREEAYLGVVELNYVFVIVKSYL